MLGKKLLLVSLFLWATSFSNTFTNFNVENVAVSISGANVTPGTYRVSPDQRILDVIKLANNNELPPLDSIDCRNIIVTNDLGISDTFDILRYINEGDLKENPYVAAGQNIQVRFATEWVFVSGDIQGVVAGNIPLKDGESARELLSLYTLNATADTNRILIERVGNKSKEFTLHQLSDVTLMSNDVITVFPLKERVQLYKVEVTGEVERPGVYAIKHGETKASAILKKCGGATAMGDLQRACILRKGKEDLLPTNEDIKATKTTIKEIGYGITNAISSGDFLIIPITEESEVLLEDGDELVMPKRELNIYISGSVKEPGSYPFIEGKTVPQYIETAGGLTKDADEESIRIVESYGEIHRMIASGKIKAGNLIVVPEENKEEERQRKLRLVQTIFSIATSVTTVAAFGYRIYDDKNDN